MFETWEMERGVYVGCPEKKKWGKKSLIACAHTYLHETSFVYKIQTIYRHQHHIAYSRIIRGRNNNSNIAGTESALLHPKRVYSRIFLLSNVKREERSSLYFSKEPHTITHPHSCAHFSPLFSIPPPSSSTPSSVFEKKRREKILNRKYRGFFPSLLDGKCSPRFSIFFSSILLFIPCQPLP